MNNQYYNTAKPTLLRIESYFHYHEILHFFYIKKNEEEKENEKCRNTWYENAIPLFGEVSTFIVQHGLLNNGPK